MNTSASSSALSPSGPGTILSAITGAVIAWFRPIGETATWGALLYLALAFPVGLFWFVFSVTLGATGIGLLIVWIGVPILIFLLFAWRHGAILERFLVRHLVGIEIETPYMPVPRGPLFGRARVVATDPATWRDPLYLLLRFPLGLATFVVLVVGLTVPLAIVASPIFAAVGEPIQFNGNGNGDEWLIELDRWWETTIAAVLGVVALGGIAHLVRLGARGHALLAVALLSPTKAARLRHRVEDLSDRRDRGVDAAAAERRRIERDLHDGAQQRLVALAMELGRARRKLDSDDPEAVRTLLDGAHLRAKEALVELRDLARGIHPAILTDRGLDAALSSLAARAAVPVEIHFGPTERLAESIESVAYFVATEALTNVAKHAAAQRAGISVEEIGGSVVLEVFDDGVGGADAGGAGLSGLADRVAAAGGRLEIESPIGGPTVVRAVVPCES